MKCSSIKITLYVSLNFLECLPRILEYSRTANIFRPWSIARFAVGLPVVRKQNLIELKNVR